MNSSEGKITIAFVEAVSQRFGLNSYGDVLLFFSIVSFLLLTPFYRFFFSFLSFLLEDSSVGSCGVS